MELNYPQNSWIIILKIIGFYQTNSKKESVINEIIQKFNISKPELAILFKNWAGVDFEIFLKFVQFDYLKNTVSKLPFGNYSLFENPVKNEIQILPEINMDVMEPNELNKLIIHYWFGLCNFGPILIGSTHKGICYLAFFTNKNSALSEMRQFFPLAVFIEDNCSIHQEAIAFLCNPIASKQVFKIHILGTSFQIKVWEKLLQIPFGALSTYGKIAHDIGNKNANRAVGSAIGSNPIAYIVPCHRVINSSFNLGHYRWDAERKAAIIGWEAAKLFTQNKV